MPASPVTIVAEVGCNHLGHLSVFRRLIDAAAEAGCTYVKGQKRDPGCLRGAHMDQPHPNAANAFGPTYRAHREALELDEGAHIMLRDYAADRGIGYALSAWDIPSADLCAELGLDFIKVPSACLTDLALLQHLGDIGRPVVLSTGMSTMEQIREALDAVHPAPIVALLACTSTYPTSPDEVNLSTIATLREHFGGPVGVSGHWEGVHIDSMAVGLGATFLERHITLSQRLPGTDHSASLEPGQLRKLVRNVRECERAMGDGVKRVYESEEPIAAKLRGAA